MLTQQQRLVSNQHDTGRSGRTGAGETTSMSQAAVRQQCYTTTDILVAAHAKILHRDAYFLIHDFLYLNHLFLSYTLHADFKTAFVFKNGPILVIDVNF